MSKKNKSKSTKINKLTDEKYELELEKLKLELVKLQQWVRLEKKKIVVLFEGRDAAGKGGVIKRITERLNPRICRVVALGVPTEKEKTQSAYDTEYKRSDAHSDPPGLVKNDVLIYLNDII